MKSKRPVQFDILIFYELRRFYPVFYCILAHYFTIALICQYTQEIYLPTVNPVSLYYSSLSPHGKQITRNLRIKKQEAEAVDVGLPVVHVSSSHL